MYEWIQEAISQGMTNPAKIHQYAREKEISVHKTEQLTDMSMQ
jgi:hypothetical protein